jgi:hypothetical protein
VFKILGLKSAPTHWRAGNELKQKSYLGTCPINGEWQIIPYLWEVPSMVLVE